MQFVCVSSTADIASHTVSDTRFPQAYEKRRPYLSFEKLFVINDNLIFLQNRVFKNLADTVCYRKALFLTGSNVYFSKASKRDQLGWDHAVNIHISYIV